MTDFFVAHYDHTGKSKKTDEMGMREMQQIAFKANSAQYLLIKAPPASGKSRALMFIALEKLHNQGIKKVIVAVPERTIGASFRRTALRENGFFADWSPKDHFNLCTAASETSKAATFIEFLNSDEQILICTHATLRNVCTKVTEERFNDCLIAIDEFHHVSVDGENRLGGLIKNFIDKSNAHIVAMTGSYFRGDNVPVLLPEYEVKFRKVTYSYYQQLNGYDHLKSLGIGYHFYTGRYFKKPSENEISALEEVLDVTKKTIIHIPNVNAVESSGDKWNEVGEIIDLIGEVEFVDQVTGVIHVKNSNLGRVLKVADLVEDEPRIRRRISDYLHTHTENDDAIDIIIALGMAKEGFDWPCCEHAITIGYRGSLTEIVQIIGRVTRDSPNKTHAQFTNLIAEPDAEGVEVKVAVNNMLKAITASLLMEQVLAPNFNFKPKAEGENADVTGTENSEGNIIRVKGLKLPTSARAQAIIDQDLNDLKARILQDEEMLKAMPGNIEPKVINKVLIPKIIRKIYPDLEDSDVEAVRQHIVLDSAVKSGTSHEEGDKKFIRMANSFVNIDDIDIELIDQVNPFQRAYEILSKTLTAQSLELINSYIQSIKSEMTELEARILWPKIQEFVEKTGNDPDPHSYDPKEQRMGEALVLLRHLFYKYKMGDIEV